MSNSSSYPTVATIIGCPQQLNATNGLVATPLGVSGELQHPLAFPDTSQIKDPIQRAVIDNICGNLPTKHPIEYIRCDVCEVDCNGNAAYMSHLSGAKHSKKLKEKEMLQYINLPYIRHNQDSNSYSCTLCGTTLNAVSQIAAHIEGQKHKSKSASKEPIAVSNSQINTDPAKPRVDATPNLLFCAACNIHVNSQQQLEQHTSSRKHISKVNGGPTKPPPRGTFKWRGKPVRNVPYGSIIPSIPKISTNFVSAGTQMRHY